MIDFLHLKNSRQLKLNRRILLTLILGMSLLMAIPSGPLAAAKKSAAPNSVNDEE